MSIVGTLCLGSVVLSVIGYIAIVVWGTVDLSKRPDKKELGAHDVLALVSWGIVIVLSLSFLAGKLAYFIARAIGLIHVPS